MMQKISVSRSESVLPPSQVLIGEVLPELERLLEGKRVVVITDENLAAAWPELTGRWPSVMIGTGEGNKTLSTVGQICRRLLEMGVDRGSYLLGIGGGIVTDITGFVASVYMRGVAGFGFVATTLLAQVDASVGGKNGVNLDGYKNIVGIFNQPDFVLCDQDILSTLPRRELRAGLAEVIKCGLIRDRNLFEMFEGKSFDEIASDKDFLLEAVTASVRLKAAVVEADEKERGDRKLLNLGHTFAHAIEKGTSEFLHGEAVAIGLCIAARISHRLGMLTESEMERIERVVASMGLPIQVPGELDENTLIAAVASDKKQEAGTIDFVLMDGIGRAVRRQMLLTEVDTVASGLL